MTELAQAQHEYRAVQHEITQLKHKETEIYKVISRIVRLRCECDDECLTCGKKRDI